MPPSGNRIGFQDADPPWIASNTEFGLPEDLLPVICYVTFGDRVQIDITRRHRRAIDVAADGECVLDPRFHLTELQLYNLPAGDTFVDRHRDSMGFESLGIGTEHPITVTTTHGIQERTVFHFVWFVAVADLLLARLRLDDEFGIVVGHHQFVEQKIHPRAETTRSQMTGAGAK